MTLFSEPNDLNKLRANVSMHQTNSGKSPEFFFTPTFIFCSPICPYNCSVVFLEKIYFSFREIIIFVRPLKYANFHRDYYPSCVASCNELLDLRYFCEYNPLFYHLNLIPVVIEAGKEIYFFGEYFCPTYFSYVEK